MNEPLTILFDGGCPLATAFVRFVGENDTRGAFRSLPLDSDESRRLLFSRGLESSAARSLVLVTPGGVWQRSDALLRIAAELQFPWPAAVVLLALPEQLRDDVFDLLAERRAVR